MTSSDLPANPACPVCRTVLTATPQSGRLAWLCAEGHVFPSTQHLRAALEAFKRLEEDGPLHDPPPSAG